MENNSQALGPVPTPVEPLPLPVSRGARVVLGALERHAVPSSLGELAHETGLHVNTLREHLGVLVRDGYVTRVRAEPDGRGRPAWLYGARPHREAAARSEYAGLATALAAALSQHSADPSADAAAAGEKWGHELARVQPEAPGLSPARRIATMLDRLGFSPLIDDSTASVRLTTCPLLDAARQYPDVVCAVHLGIVRGALAEFGAAPDGTRLLPFVEPGACRVDFPPSAMQAS